MNPPTDTKAATEAAPPSLQSARALIEVTYPALANAGDADAYAALYTPDAFWSPPDAPDRRGPAWIRFGFIAKHADIDALMHVDDAALLGPAQAFVTALARVRVMPRVGGAGAAFTHYYRGLWLLRAVQGQWKIERQMWTMKPAAPLVAFFDTLAAQRLAEAEARALAATT